MVMPTIFSRIVAGELPSHQIAQSTDFYAFLDIRPVTMGHTLVIPKIEVDEFFDLDEEILAQMMVFARPIAQALKEVTQCVRVGAVVAGFDVPHAHLHLIPTNEMADLDFSRARSVPSEQLAEIALKVRERLARRA